MSRPLIGLTVGPEHAESDALRLRMTYTRAVEAAGGVPVLVPPVNDADALRTLLERLDGLIFPGGLDVEPAAYGETRGPTTETNPPLDRLELAAARWAIGAELPTLGICRGQQLLNVALGGSLIQHLDGHRQGLPREALTHDLRIDPDSRLAQLLGAAHVQVNSHHHQAVHRLGGGLRAVAWAPDGTIEGVESSAHPWLVAVQFHPEELVGFHAPSQQLFGAFVDVCRTGRLKAAPSYTFEFP